MKRIFTVLLFLSTHISWSQVTFTKQLGPTGANVGDLEINSASNLFALVTSSESGNYSRPSAGSVYRSTNNGTDWTKVSTSTNGLNDSDAYDIFIDAADNIYVLGKTKIYKSSAASNGDTWTSFTPASPFVGGDEITKTTDGEIYLVHNGLGVFRSTDDGATWSNISNNLPSPSNYEVILAVGNDVYVGVLNDGTYKLANNATSWTDFNNGISLPDQPGSLALKGSTLYQTNRDGVYYYNGTTWVFMGGPTGSGATLIAESFNSSDHIVVSGPGNKVYVVMSDEYGGKGKIYSSANATTGPWTSITAAAELTQSLWAMRTFNSANDAFVGTAKNGVLRSTDNGTTWDVSNGGLLLSPALSMIRGDINTSFTRRFFIADGSPYVFYSDYGSSWSRSTLNSCTSCLFSTVHKKANGDLLAIGNQTYRSTDDGTNWADIGGPLTTTYMQHVAIGTGTHVYGHNYSGGIHSFQKSTDGNAVTWATLAITGLPTSYLVEKMVVDASNNLYIHLQNYTFGGEEIYKVTSAGTAATKITNTLFGTEIYDIHGFAGDLYVLGYNNTDNKYQIAKTTNGGTSWTRTNVQDGLEDFVIAAAGVIVGREVAGNQSIIYYSNDSGATWTSAITEGYHTDLIGALIDSEGHLTLALNGAPVNTSDSPIYAPAAPTNLAALSAGKDQVVLEWDHDGLYVDHFEIHRRIQGQPTFTLIESYVDYRDRYYSDDSPHDVTDYEYQVVAKSPSGTVGSSILTVGITDACTLTIPDNRSWTGTVPGGFINATIGIQKGSGDQYIISEFTAGSMESVAKLTGGTYNQTAVDGVFYGNCGLPFIQPTNSLYPNGAGTWSAGTNTLTLNFTIDKAQYTGTDRTITLVLNPTDPVPAAASNVAALILTNSTVEVSWSAGLFQHDYIVERAIGAGAYTQVATVDYPTTKYVDNSTLVAGTTYKYRVTARNNAGISQVAAADEATLVFRNPYLVVANSTLTDYDGFLIGAQWADFNNDKLPDFFALGFDFVSETGQNLIYKNLGNGNFEQVPVVMEDKVYQFSSLADYDNDGFIDIAVSIDEVNGLDIYKGGANLTFTLVDGGSLGDLSANAVPGNSSWADINNDGLLDLFNWGSSQKRLFKQNADHSFTLLTGDDIATDSHRSNGGFWADYNGDGFQDLLVTNDDSGGPVRLFKNDGDNTFSLTSGIGFDALEASNATWGDYNNDGHIDLFTSNEGGYALYKNDGDGTFTKDVSTSISTLTNNANPGVSSWGDFNNDGYLDLITSGFGVPTYLFLRNPGTTVSFTKIEDEKLNDPRVYRYGMANADYNQDGHLDLGSASFSFSEIQDTFLPGNSNLMVNNVTTGSWSLVRLIGGTGNNKEAIGAKIRVSVGSTSYYRTIQSVSSFVSRNSTIAHFGLGSASTITSIQVTWPNGVVQTYSNPPINQLITITQDNTGPIISDRTPANDANDVVSNTSLSITLNETSSAVASKNLVIIGEGDVTPAATLAVTGATVSDKTFTFSLPSRLTLGKKYNVTIDAGAFTDIYGNASLAVSGWSFTVSSGPVIGTLAPANNAANVPANTLLAITFAGPTNAVAGKSLRMYKTTDLVNPVEIIDAGDGVVSGNTITYTPLNKLSRATEYQVSIDAGAFVNSGGDAFAGAVADNWKFTSATGPIVSSLTPSSGAKNVSAAVNFVIQFNTNITAVPGKSVFLFIKGVPTAVATLNATDATINGNKATFNPPNNLGRNKTFLIGIEAGAFVDAAQNDFIGLPPADWEISTDPGPNLTSISPAHNASEIAINTPLVITYDENITAVAGKKIYVFDGTTEILNADVTAGVVNGKTFTFTPINPLPNQKLLSVVLEEAAFVDSNENGVAGFATGEWNFTTVDAPDTQPPVFAATLPASYDKGFGTQTLSIDITDNKAVTSAKAFIRAISGTTFSEVVGTAKPNNKWEFAIPETAFDANGIELYFTATDAASNAAREPATGNSKINLKYTSPIDVSTTVGFGGERSSWKIFAYPFEGSNSVQSVFDELNGETAKQDYRILSYQNSPAAWKDYPADFSTFARGTGYFVNIKTTKVVSVPAATAPSNTKSNLFKITLKQGWNLLGNPYLTQINWSDVAAFNGLTGTEAEFRVYNGSSNSYDKKTTAIEPYTGGFVLATANKEISIPFLGQTSGGRLEEIEFENGDWLLPITVVQAGTINELGGLGMHKNASRSFDDLDRVNAPHLFDFVEINFAHPEHFMKKFSRDVVTTQEEYVWDFMVETSMTDNVTLQWDASAVPAGLYLYDEAQEIPVNMQEVNRYTFMPGRASKFKVYYGEKSLDKIRSRGIVLGAAFPNPTASAATIPFSLPETNATYQVQVDVFDMMGRKVGTTMKAELKPGFYQTNWTPQDGQAEGIYTYRLAVSSGATNEVLTGKLMLKK